MLVFQEFHQIFIASSKSYIHQLNFPKISGNVRIFWSSCERSRTSQHFLRNRKRMHFNCGAGFTRQNLSCEVLSGNINLQQKNRKFQKSRLRILVHLEHNNPQLDANDCVKRHCHSRELREEWTDSLQRSHFCWPPWNSDR